jgi:hypothetical protein
LIAVRLRGSTTAGGCAIGESCLVGGHVASLSQAGID